MDQEKGLREKPIAKEGLVFIIPSFVFSILFYIFHLKILFIVSFFFFIFCLFFFRNPRRSSGDVKDTLISPADGRIMEIKDMFEGEFIGTETKRVSIFMSLTSVHVNRAPCEGKIARVVHRDGEFALAFKKDIDKENERNYILIEKGKEKFLLVQIAGFLARRITSYVKEGDYVKQGDPVGIIAFGSRVDIYVPKGYETMVTLNDKVKAGETHLAMKGGI
ncbi:MAG: phosphatidylserine decarboxylase family protein [Proteobacteria bacterium]|nr:phosphatidylserine decarboxylase family protein [Pseudomonadota bacterium]